MAKGMERTKKAGREKTHLALFARRYVCYLVPKAVVPELVPVGNVVVFVEIVSGKHDHGRSPKLKP